MPVQVVMEQARERHLVGLRHGIATALGVLLVLVGWATLPAAGVLAFLTYHHWGHRTVVEFVVALVVLLFVAPVVGRRLVRGPRRLVLFLRRFGYTDATQALTFATLTTIGRSWRLVTLDDAAVAPVGFSDATERLAAAGEVGTKWAGRAWDKLAALPFLVMWGGIAGMAGAAGYTAQHHHPVLTMMKHAVGHDHARYAGPPHVFRICLIVAIVGGLAIVASMLVRVAAVPLAQPWRSFSGAVRRAEQAKVRHVGGLETPNSVAHAVRRQARKVFSPRLMVLHVANEVWRPVVKSFAEISSVVLIDLSDPTENLLWEISEVVRDPETVCVLVGNAERLRALEVIDTPIEERLMALLDGRTILAYDTSEEGMQRFARALRATLELAIA